MGNRGFTLLEMLLSVAIIGLIVSLSLPVYQSFQSRTDLDVSAEQLVHTLRRAQTYSRGAKGDSQWGVRVQNASMTLFKGTSYETRDSALDEVISIPPTFTVSGLSDVVFSKMLALPNSTGSVVIAHGSTNNTRTVSINAQGMVSY